jgi:hypothetical protein
MRLSFRAYYKADQQQDTNAAILHMNYAGEEV